MHVGAAVMAKLEQHKARLQVVMMTLLLLLLLMLLLLQARITKQSSCIEDMRREEVSDLSQPFTLALAAAAHVAALRSACACASRRCWTCSSACTWSGLLLRRTRPVARHRSFARHALFVERPHPLAHAPR